MLVFVLLGILFNLLKVSSCVGVVWQRGGFSVLFFVNYWSGVINWVDYVKFVLFIMFDVVFCYVMGESDDVWLGLEFVLLLDNVFDCNLLFYQVVLFFYVVLYDFINYLVIGCFVSFFVFKYW